MKTPKSFVKGQRVSVLDDNLSGVVTSVNQYVTVLMDDGFEIDFSPTELVIEHDSKELKKLMIPDRKSVADKEFSKRRNQEKLKPKDRTKPDMVVDLHIHLLVKSTKGMESHDMLLRQLDTAKYHLEMAIAKKMRKIVFIHGVGEGVLRSELEYLFRRYDHLNYYDANYKEFGQGAVEVYIPQKAIN